jgi:hypothetical protein
MSVFSCILCLMKKTKLNINQKIENVIKKEKNNPHFKAELKEIKDSLSLPKQSIKKPKTEEDYRKDVKNYITDRIIDEKTYYSLRKKFEEKYGLEFFGEAFNFLLLYNDISLINKFGWQGFIGIYDLNMYLKFKEDGVQHSKESIYNLLQLIAETTPIVIFINPYMSRNDIVNLIDENKDSLQLYQKHYRKDHIQIGSQRTPRKKVQLKRDFIYKNRELKNQGLTQEVNKKFNTDHGHSYVHQILREEIKRKK